MKRGMPRGRGNRPMPRGQQNSAPFVNDLGLKDIDMELELLKRKREIIEQQQQMLSINYNRQSYDYDESESYNDDRYDRSYGSQNYGGGGSSNRKRSIPVWEHESPPKRFSAPGRGAKRSFESRLGPPPNKPRQQSSYQPAAPRPKRPNLPPQRNKDFHPTKVTKPRAAAPPPLMKLNLPAQRKLLVDKAMDLTKAVAASPASDDELILRSDREPSRQVNGRLELALGGIMKDLKAANAEHEAVFLSHASMRVMKQVVRERIRTAMIGKKVVNPEYVKTVYYDTYPKGDDTDIVTRGLETLQSVRFMHAKADTPQQYFKKNMSRLMIMKMNQMFNKIESFYYENTSVKGPTKRKYRAGYSPYLLTTKPKIDNEKPTEHNIDVGPQATEPKAGELANAPNIDTPNIDTPIAEASKVDTPIAEEPKVYTPLPDTPMAEPSETDGPNVVPPKAEVLQDNDVEMVEIQPKTDDKAPNTQQGSQVGNQKPGTADNKVKVYEDDIISTEKFKAYDKLLTTHMIHLLKKFVPDILKILNLDNMYREIQASINEGTRKMLGGTANTTGESNQHPHATNDNENKRTFHQPLPYWVKLMGKPNLPKRKAMQAFFDQFNPKIIKKHRSIHNLLFVGFADKEPFDNILAATGTAIGRHTLDIIVSERKFNKNQNAGDNTVENAADTNANTADNNASIADNASTADNTSTAETFNDSADQLIGSDIDQQISDLLTSIRKAEENQPVSEEKITEENNESEKIMIIKDDIITENKDNITENNDDITVIKDDITEIKDDITEIRDDNKNLDESITEIINEAPKIDLTDDNVLENTNNAEDAKNDVDIVELKDVPNPEQEINNEDTEMIAEESEKKNAVEALKADKNEIKTPTRASARLASTSTIKTRRTSTLP